MSDHDKMMKLNRALNEATISDPKKIKAACETMKKEADKLYNKLHYELGNGGTPDGTIGRHLGGVRVGVNKIHEYCDKIIKETKNK